MQHELPLPLREVVTSTAIDYIDALDEVHNDYFEELKKEVIEEVTNSDIDNIATIIDNRVKELFSVVNYNSWMGKYDGIEKLDACLLPEYGFVNISFLTYVSMLQDNSLIPKDKFDEIKSVVLKEIDGINIATTRGLKIEALLTQPEKLKELMSLL